MRIAYWLFLAGLAIASAAFLWGELFPTADLFSRLEQINIELGGIALGALLVVASFGCFFADYWGAYVECRWQKDLDQDLHPDPDLYLP